AGVSSGASRIASNTSRGRWKTPIVRSHHAFSSAADDSTRVLILASLVAVLETERLLLEAWSDRYLEEYLELLADSETMRFLHGARTREQGLGQFVWYERHWRRRGFGPLWAIEKEARRWIGLIGLRDVEREP